MKGVGYADLFRYFRAGPNSGILSDIFLDDRQGSVATVQMHRRRIILALERVLVDDYETGLLIAELLSFRDIQNRDARIPTPGLVEQIVREGLGVLTDERLADLLLTPESVHLLHVELQEADIENLAPCWCAAIDDNVHYGRFRSDDEESDLHTEPVHTGNLTTNSVYDIRRTAAGATAAARGDLEVRSLGEDRWHLDIPASGLTWLIGSPELLDGTDERFKVEVSYAGGKLNVVFDGFVHKLGAIDIAMRIGVAEHRGKDLHFILVMESSPGAATPAIIRVEGTIDGEIVRRIAFEVRLKF